MYLCQSLWAAGAWAVVQRHMSSVAGGWACELMASRFEIDQQLMSNQHLSSGKIVMDSPSQTWVRISALLILYMDVARRL